MDVLIEPVSAAMISVMWRWDDGFVTVGFDRLGWRLSGLKIDLIVSDLIQRTTRFYAFIPMRE
ncbi:hypothetical protein [Pseudomonas syringae]|uniref:hypothetical protein n=1 Tax=Pseudomonas syringae TaxID=317 RepID=UPI00111291D4|nr:hypothetical protein [Pseudomonas syringae]